MSFPVALAMAPRLREGLIGEKAFFVIGGCIPCTMDSLLVVLRPFADFCYILRYVHAILYKLGFQRLP